MLFERTLSVSVIKATAVISASMAVVACGGGTSTSAPSQNPPPATLTGTFIDSPVANIGYRTDSIASDATDSQGQFSYLAGESVTFSIGDIDLPPVVAASVITPLDIVGTQDINDPSVVNIARLLQSLDEDGIPENGISIGDGAHQSATGMSLNFSSATFAANPDVINLVANSGSENTALISVEDALLHLQETLESLESFGAPADLLVNVTLTATSISWDDPIEPAPNATLYCGGYDPDGINVVGDVETYQERWEIDGENNVTATGYNNVDSWVETGTYDPETQTLSIANTRDEEILSGTRTYFSGGSWNSDASFVSQTGSELTFSGSVIDIQTTSWDYPNNDGQPNGVDEVTCVTEFTLDATAVPYPAEL
jgi:hypothetical protein